MDIVFSSDEINTWKRVSYTFDTRVSIDTSEPIYLIIYAHNNPEGSSYIKNIKLEKGNMMSQWTPSQFDVDDSLNDVIESTKDYVNESIESYNSSIDIKFDSITSRVERTENGINDVDSKYTEIKQTIDSIDLTGVVKFKDLYTPGATVITGENIETGTVSVESLKSNNSNPIIKLFPTTASDGTRSYCSLDATKQYEQGVGTAIRLKWDSMNYLLQRRSGVEFYMEPREQGASFNFQSDYGHQTSKYESSIITKDGTLCFRRNSNTDESTSSLYFYTGSQNYDRKLLTSYDMSNSVSSTSTNAVATAYAVKQAYDKAVSAYNVGNHSHPYASSSHSHSGYASSSHSHSGSSWNSLTVTKLYGGYLYLENGSSTSWSMLFLGHASPYSNNGYALGQTSKRWQTAYLVSSPNVSSDINTKENVRYIDDNVSLLSDDSITTSDFLSFIENDLKLARYDYKINQETYDEFDDIAKANSLQASQNQLGFIAQDVKDTKVGSILIQEDIDGLLSYNTGNLTSIIAGALQEEIKQRKNLEEEVKQLKELVNKLLEKGDE